MAQEKYDLIEDMETFGIEDLESLLELATEEIEPRVAPAGQLSDGMSAC
jgi:hypothetical protein